MSGAPSCTSRTTTSAPSASRTSALALTSSMMLGDLDVGDPGGAHERRQVLGHCADEADLDVAEVLDPTVRVRAEGVAVVGLLAHVGGDVLPLGAALGVGRRVVRRHDPVEQVVVALVELVVAGGRHVEARLVQRVDGRLVVLDERLERRGADEVAGGRRTRCWGCWRAAADRTGLPARSRSAPGCWSRSASARRPWKSLVAEDLDVDGGGAGRRGRGESTTASGAATSPATAVASRDPAAWTRMLTRDAFRGGEGDPRHPNPASPPSTPSKGCDR